jgi:hypothetical protein
MFKTDAVINLSSRTLTDTELNVLARGFNFRPSLPDVPIKDYILATEAYIKTANLDDTNSNFLRNTIVHEIEHMKRKQKHNPPKSNLTPAEWKAIKSLKEDDSIIIIPADKGNKTVVLPKDLYLSKLEDRIKTHTYTACRKS